jgi:hypothetical protein
MGSSGSGNKGVPGDTLQNLQLRVHSDPSIMKVEVFCEKHSNMLGQLASWQTVFKDDAESRFLTFWYCPPAGSGFLSQAGLGQVDFITVVDS